jgi:uroporphyrinogen decarboxylase
MTPSDDRPVQAQPKPDFDNLRRTLLRQGPPGPVPFAELFADPGTMEAVLGEKFPLDLRGLVLTSDGETIAPAESSLERLLKAKQVVDMILRFCLETGYDYVYMYPGIDFPRSNFHAATDTASLKNWSGGKRFWQDEETGPIQNWADFEAYPWPTTETVSYTGIEYLNAVMPEGMKICVDLPGILENASWLMGLQSFSYALFDQPDLIKAIVQRVADVVIGAAAHVAAFENVGMFFLGDDMGFYSGTLVSPKVLRDYIFPYHRKLVDTVHAQDRPILLHSCGNLEKVMDDIIDVGFDAKHSFEDKIMPVEEVYRRWGDRITIIGGVDMDILARGSEEDVRRRTRQILDVCAVNGTGYCLGTGNTVANYVPKANYLAMLDEGRRWNREHFGVE